MTYTEEDIKKIKEIVFSVDKDGALEGIVNREGLHEFGEIRKYPGKDSYYLYIKNSKTKARNLLEIHKEIAEDERYKDLFYDANELASASMLTEKIKQEIEKSKVTSKKERKIPIISWLFKDINPIEVWLTGIVGTIIAFELVVPFTKSYYLNSPSYLAKKEEQEKKEYFFTAYNYILPPEGESRVYNLKNGSKAVVSHNANSGGFFETGWNKLEIVVEKEAKFSSIDKDPYDGKFDFYKLDELSLYNGKEWEEFPWRSINQWQVRYENLIKELYGARNNFENNAGKQFDDKLKNSKNQGSN